MATIKLYSGETVLLDDEDFKAMSQYTWYLGTEGDAITNVKVDGKWATGRMHRMIMHTLDGMECDHRHHIKLDNRKSELRNCTKIFNQGNRIPNRNGKTSRYKGVSWHNRRKKWVAQLRKHGKKSAWLGYFNDEASAARTYDKAARMYFGEFALTNF